MQRSPHLTLSPFHKAVLWIIGLVVAAKCLYIAVSSRAFLEFLAAGELPGIHTVLSPDTVLWLLGPVFGVVTLLVFRREVARLFRRVVRLGRTRARRGTTLGYYLLLGTDLLPDAPAAAANGRWRRMLTALSAGIDRFLHRSLPHLGMLGHVLASALEVIWQLCEIAGVLIVMATVFVVEACIEGWHRAKPYLHRLDKWLERQTKAVIGSNGLQTLQGMRDEFRRDVSAVRERLARYF